VRRSDLATRLGCKGSLPTARRRGADHTELLFAAVRGEPGLFVFGFRGSEWSSNIFHVATNPRTGRCCHREWGSTTHATALRRVVILSGSASIGASVFSQPLPRSSTARIHDAATMYRPACASKRFVIFVDAANAYREALMEDFSPATATARLASIFLLTGQIERALNEMRRSPPRTAADSKMHQWIFGSVSGRCVLVRARWHKQHRISFRRLCAHQKVEFVIRVKPA